MFVLYGVDVAFLVKLSVGHNCQVDNPNIGRSEGAGDDALANHASVKHVTPSAACKYVRRLDQAAFSNKRLHCLHYFSQPPDRIATTHRAKP
jgi:hypothetical protein